MDKHPLDAVIAVSVGQLRKGAPSGPDLQHVSPGAPCLDPSASQTTARAELALLGGQLLKILDFNMERAGIIATA